MTISVVLSVYNEENNIKDCLESVKDLADEIIVVDNSSTDNTAAIAKKYTTHVYSQKNDERDIDGLKNFGFKHATSKWTFCIDADERVTPELAAEIKEMVGQESEFSGYWISRKNIIFGKWIQNDMWWPDYQLRLFKTGSGKYTSGKVHRNLEVEGATEKLNSPLTHLNYTYTTQYVEKLNKYTTIEAEGIISSGYKFNWLDAIRFPVNDFVKTFFLQKGYKDGLHGLVLSMLQAFYMEVVFVKVWEKEGFREYDNENFIDLVMKEFKQSILKAKYWVASVKITETKNPFKKARLKVARKISLNRLKPHE